MLAAAANHLSGAASHKWKPSKCQGWRQGGAPPAPQRGRPHLPLGEKRRARGARRVFPLSWARGQMTVLPREKRKKGTAGRGSATFPPPGPRVTLAPGWAPSPRAPRPHPFRFFPSRPPPPHLFASHSPPLPPRLSSPRLSPHVPCSLCWQNLLLVLFPQRKREAVCCRAERRKLLDLSTAAPPSAGSAPRRWDPSPELPRGDPR